MLLACNVYAQRLTYHENIATEDKLKSVLSYLSDDYAEGRASGTKGKQYVERYLVEKFKEFGLKPYKWNYTQSFNFNDSIAVRNVVGIVTAQKFTDEYIVVCAHYDHLGTIRGNVYNGADDNASGVAALLEIAEIFAQMRKDGNGPSKNIIFAALDGKELSLAGSEYFVNTLSIPKSKISCAVNLDILGTTLVPPGRRKDYLIVLGNNTLPESKREIVEHCNRLPRFMMDVRFDFYGSRDFTKLMLSNGDHTSFSKMGIPVLFFTSGFHEYTYKTTDDMVIIDFDVLLKRTRLIFNIINRL